MKILKLMLCIVGLLTLMTVDTQAQCAYVENTLCIKKLGKAQGPKRCAPGQNRIKVEHESCKGTGYYLHNNMKCGVCRGTGVTYVENTQTPQVGDGNCYSCYKCCGDGRKVHTTCRGKGWVWVCVDG